MEYIIFIGICSFFYWLLKQNKQQTHKTPVVKVAFNRNPVINDDPSQEANFWKVKNLKRVSTKAKIKYEDADKRVSTRNISIYEYGGDGKAYYIHCYCELRGESRTFKIDRIKSYIDLRSGELVSNIIAHLDEIYENSPQPMLDKLTSEYTDALVVLYHTAKADGQYRAAEKEVIRNYLVELLNDARISAEMVSEAISSIGTPTLNDLKISTLRIIRAGKIDPKRLFICCKEIIATQKTVHINEQKILDFLGSEIN